MSTIRRSRRVAKLPAAPAGIDPEKAELLYHPGGDHHDRAVRDYLDTFGSICNVPRKYPGADPKETPYDIIIHMLEADRCRKDIVTLQSVNREWCFAVRRHRFAKLQLTPDSRPKRLLNVWRPDTLLPHLRQVDIFGGLDLWSQISDEEFDELPLGWLNKLLPLLQQISRHSPLEILRVEDLYWPALTPEIRECLLRGFPHIYALHIMNVDFRNSNQLLRTLNAFPQVQYLWIGDLSYDSQSHTLSQISRTEPLFLREVYLPSAYTGLFLDWLLGQRNTLVVERLRIAVRDLYRDDAKLVRLIRKVGPWLKSLKYLEYSGLEVSQGRVYYREDRCGPAQTREREPRVNGRGTDGDEGEQSDDEDMEMDAREPYPATGDLPRDIPPEYLQEFHDTSSLLHDQFDEDQVGTRDTDLSYAFPAWSWREDYGYAEFAAQLVRPISTPMLEHVVARIHWKNDMSLLTLKMLSRMTFPPESFWRLIISIYFENEEVLRKAPWRDIDDCLQSLTYPEATEQLLMIATRGWDLCSREVALAKRDEVLRRLPRTAQRADFELHVVKWARASSEFVGKGIEDWVTGIYYS
ncbi:hypothetical protein ACG7TL_009045 [Trametes sanguinea]